MLPLDGDKDRYLPALGKARRYFDPPFFHLRFRYCLPVATRLVAVHGASTPRNAKLFANLAFSLKYRRYGSRV